MEGNEFQVKLRNVRISARKARLVANLVRGKAVVEALDSLKLMNKRAAPMFAKLIESGVANAQQVATTDVDRLVVAETYVNEGPTLYRFIPRAQGRATPVRKRSSHIVVKLEEI